MRVRTVLQDVSKDILKVVEMCLMPLPSAGYLDIVYKKSILLFLLNF